MCISRQLFRHLLFTDDGVCSVCRKHVTTVVYYLVPEPEFTGCGNQSTEFSLRVSEEAVLKRIFVSEK